MASLESELYKIQTPDPLVGWVGGNPLPIPYPLDAFGVSLSTPSASILTPPLRISGYATAAQSTHSTLHVIS